MGVWSERAVVVVADHSCRKAGLLSLRNVVAMLTSVRSILESLRLLPEADL